MSARAIITRYSDESATQAGNFILSAHYFVCDPALQGTGSGMDGRAESIQLELPAAAPASWAGIIENAVIADCIARGFTDLTAVTTFMPTIA